jgi:hypothetical protein
VHAEDRGHQRHIIVTPDTAVIVDDIGWNADDPKRNVNPDIFVVINYKLDLPSLRLSFLERPLLTAIVSLLPQRSRSPWERS